MPTPRSSSRFRAPFLAGGALIAALCLPLRASADPLWICALTAAQTRLVCLADVDTDTDADADAAPAPAPVPVRGVRYPLDVRRRYEIDLLGPAADFEWVEQLARGTLCLRTPGCQVLLTGVPVPGPMRPAVSTAFGAWRRG